MAGESATPLPSGTDWRIDDTMPCVTLERSPSGLPIASTMSPTFGVAEPANLAGGGVAPDTWTTARSCAVSDPTRVAVWRSPPDRVTWSCREPRTTCAFVTTSPWMSNTTPEPSPMLLWICTTCGETVCTTCVNFSCRPVNASGVEVVAALPESPQPAARAGTAARAESAAARRMSVVLVMREGCGRPCLRAIGDDVSSIAEGDCGSRRSQQPRGMVPNRLRRTHALNIVAAVAIATTGLFLIVLAASGTFSSSSTIGQVKLVTEATAAPQTPNSQTFPFGAPAGKPDYAVPTPPGQPTLVPTIGTKTTQRLYGADPFQEAVSVTQHVWPSALPENAPNENNNDPDRPWGVTLLTPDDPLTAITAVPLLHFPDDAPVLYVTKQGIPQVTENELKRLGDTGMSRYHNVDAFLVGAAANPSVERQLKAMGMKYVTVTAPTVPALANTVDKLYGEIENPDTGVPDMGNGAQNVMIGSMDAYQYVLPATHWVAHMASGLLWVKKDSVPQATIDALKRRNGQARMYLFGGPQQISGAVADQLSRYGTVLRVTNDDIVAFNAPPKDTPVDTAIAFAKMWDAPGEVGWKITGPGHGFTLVNIDDWQAAVASAPLSHLGFHAPLLSTDSSKQLPPELDAYLKSVAPTYLTSPADGPYNMTYVIGNWEQIPWPVQAHVDYISEMANRRTWNTTTGGRYTDSQP